MSISLSTVIKRSENKTDSSPVFSWDTGQKSHFQKSDTASASNARPEKLPEKIMLDVSESWVMDNNGDTAAIFSGRNIREGGGRRLVLKLLKYLLPATCLIYEIFLEGLKDDVFGRIEANTSMPFLFNF